jgi:hypothetical protein
VANASSIPRITAVTLVHILRNWGWEKEKVADGEGVIGNWFAKRRRLTVKDLSAVRLILKLLLKSHKLSLVDSLPSSAHPLQR